MSIPNYTHTHTHTNPPHSPPHIHTPTDLSDCRFLDNEALENIAKCSTTLEYLDVSGLERAEEDLDRGAACLASLVNLRELHMAGVGEKGLSPLAAGLPGLQTLTFLGHHKDPIGAVRCLAQLTTLRHLGLLRRRFPWGELSSVMAVVRANPGLRTGTLNVWYTKRSLTLRGMPDNGTRKSYVDLGRMFLKTHAWAERAKVTCYRRAIAAAS
jgi:hypothetical protein